MGDEKLASVGRWPRVGHGKNAFSCVFESWVDFITEFVAWAARASSLRATTLNHEVFDDSVKDQAIVVGAFPAGLHGAFGKADEAADGERALFKFQRKYDFAVVSINVRKYAFGGLCGHIGVCLGCHKSYSSEETE